MKKAKIFILIIAIIALIAAVVLAIVSAPPQIGPGKNQAGAGEITNVEIASEIYGFTGEIKEIKDNTLTLEATIPLADIQKEPIKITLTALVTDQTKIVKLKFPTTIKDKTKPVYPEETVIKFSDLKVGDKIDVAAIKNLSEKIENGTEFSLDRILIIAK
jgi:hypothetical protein